MPGSVRQLVENLSSSMDDSMVRRYADPNLLNGVVDSFDASASSSPSSGTGTMSPGELTSDAKERTRRLVKDSLASLIDDNELWNEFFGGGRIHRNEGSDQTWSVRLSTWSFRLPRLDMRLQRWPAVAVLVSLLQSWRELMVCQ